MEILRSIITGVFILFGSALAPVCTCARAQNPGRACPRPAVGSTVTEPADLRSENGVLRATLTYHQPIEPNGAVRYCYIDENGNESPNLRVKPGDLIVLTLKNEIQRTSQGPTAGAAARPLTSVHGAPMPDSCAGGGEMSAVATNIHFHGLSIPAECHQDDVLRTSILPGDPGFEYRFRIPATQPPGLYWYHPHMHGFSKVQVLGGASGALIVEGIERANSELAGLPERVLVIRDQDLLNPNAPPKPGDVIPPVILDADGDARNTGNGSGMPAKDLSVNFAPVPYPGYEPAVIYMKPRQRELWRILNASAITYLNLQIVFNEKPEWIALVGLDGVPLNYSGRTGKGILWQTHVGLPPAGRAEFVVAAPAQGVATLLTRSVDTGLGGENDPVRPIARIVVSGDAPEPRSKLAAAPEPLPRASIPWLGDVTPVRTRKLYFSETLRDPKDPNSPTTFFITVDGQQPVPFDPSSTAPNIVAQNGDVEDWIIENRSQELHDFHIHQTHFLLIERFGTTVSEPFLRDTINIPFWDGKTSRFPSVKLRMDFRDPGVVGTFPYHCHLLEHEDGGMMGLIRIEPAVKSKAQSPSTQHPAEGWMISSKSSGSAADSLSKRP